MKVIIIKLHLPIILAILLFSCRSSNQFSIENNLNKLDYYEGQVANPNQPSSNRKWNRIEEEKDYEILDSIKKTTNINNYIKNCFGPDNKEKDFLKSRKIYGIRKIETQF